MTSGFKLLTTTVYAACINVCVCVCVHLWSRRVLHLWFEDL